MKMLSLRHSNFDTVEAATELCKMLANAEKLTHCWMDLQKGENMKVRVKISFTGDGSQLTRKVEAHRADTNELVATAEAKATQKTDTEIIQ